MTEADLRRLAQLLTELSANQPQTFWETWGVPISLLLSFMLGFASNRIESWFSAKNRRKAILKPNREELYRLFVNYRECLQKVSQAKEVSSENNRIVKEVINCRILIARNLNSVDDVKYARLASKILLGSSELNLDERIKELDKVIEKVRKDALPLYQVLEQQADSKQKSGNS